MILRVGLTGGIASGKSTVARFLAACGAAVIDADQIVRELYAPGAKGHQVLIAQYGAAILTPEGHINRPSLARMALSTEEGARRLNSLIHPLVHEEQERWFRSLAGSEAIAVVEATLLLESGSRARFDRIIVVESDAGSQLQRAVRRGLTEEEVRNRMARQLSSAERRRAADYLIINDGGLMQLEEKTRAVYDSLKHDLTTRRTGSAESSHS